MFGHHHRTHSGGPNGRRPDAMHFGRGPFGRDGASWSEGGRNEGGDGRRGGRRRVFDGSELRLVLLALLETQPRHGYDLIREIEERSGGAYAPSPGVVYPALTMLDEMGQVDEVHDEGTRRRFAISEAGCTHLGERRAQADALLARLDAMGAARAETDRAPIGRAIANLRMALRNAGTNADAARQDAIVAILDDAARRIERGA